MYFVNKYKRSGITFFLWKFYNLKIMKEQKNTLRLFGRRLKELRTKNKITQEKLAEIIGVEQQQICRIEKGGCFTTIDNLERLSKALKVPVDELFNFSHQKDSDALMSDLHELLKKASESQLKLIYRIVNDILK